MYIAQNKYLCKYSFDIYIYKLFLFPGSRTPSRVFLLYVQYLAGCRDSNPRCCHRSQCVTTKLPNTHFFVVMDSLTLLVGLYNFAPSTRQRIILHTGIQFSAECVIIIGEFKIPCCGAGPFWRLRLQLRMMPLVVYKK